MPTSTALSAGSGSSLRRMRILAACLLITACTATATPMAKPVVSGATVTTVEPARTLCSGEPPTIAAPTTHHTIVRANAIGTLRRAGDTPASRTLTKEYAAGLAGSGQRLLLLDTFADAAVHAKAVVLTAGKGAYGHDRLAFLCGTATGYVSANVTLLKTSFTDQLACFEVPKGTKPVLCAWYDDTAGSLTITGAKGAKALALAVAIRTALEQPTTG